jgi:quercetin dioxygenase-like cupin family protein
MFPNSKTLESMDWVPGPYPGVDLAILERDPVTGGVTVLRRFRSGITVPAHVHPAADEWVCVISGEWVEDDRTYGPGSILQAPRGVPHGPHHARTEVLSLTRFNGPLTVAPAIDP